jgi:hypothetical protein
LQPRKAAIQGVRPNRLNDGAKFMTKNQWPLNHSITYPGIHIAVQIAAANPYRGHSQQRLACTRGDGARDTFHP